MISSSFKYLLEWFLGTFSDLNCFSCLIILYFAIVSGRKPGWRWFWWRGGSWDNLLGSNWLACYFNCVGVHFVWIPCWCYPGNTCLISLPSALDAYFLSWYSADPLHFVYVVKEMHTTNYLVFQLWMRNIWSSLKNYHLTLILLYPIHVLQNIVNFKSPSSHSVSRWPFSWSTILSSQIQFCSTCKEEGGDRSVQVYSCGFMFQIDQFNQLVVVEEIQQMLMATKILDVV